MSAETVTELNKLITTTPVVVLSKSWCPYCKEAKQVLNSKGLKSPKIVIKELDQMADGSAWQSAGTSVSQRGHRTVPMIWIGGEFVGGASDLNKLSGSDLNARLIKAKAL